MDALKPCPFCGGAMELIHDHTTEDIDRIRHRLPQINCPINGASGFSVGNDQLVAAWNHRPEAERLVEALEAMLATIEARWPGADLSRSSWNEPVTAARAALTAAKGTDNG